jgi:tripartite ATP-independent transporter DctP family solute receptor
MKLTSRFIVTLAVLCSVVMMASFALAGPLKGWSAHPVGYPTDLGQQAFANEITKATNGKFKFKIFPQMTLGAQNSAIDQLRFGVIDWAVFNLGPLSETVPEFKLLTLPYVFKSDEHMYRVMDSEIGDKMAAAMTKHGLVGLGWYGSGARSFYTSKKPVKSVEDLKGMKFRVMKTAVFVDTIEALGAKAAPLPYSEVYTAIKTGVVDGAENNWPSYESSGHYEVAKYYTLDMHSVVPEILCVSKKLWDSLTDAEKEIFKKAAAASEPVMRKAWRERAVKSREKVIAAGSQVFKVDNTTFAAKMGPVYKKYLTPELSKILKQIQAID